MDINVKRNPAGYLVAIILTSFNFIWIVQNCRGLMYQDNSSNIVWSVFNNLNGENTNQATWLFAGSLLGFYCQVMLLISPHYVLHFPGLNLLPLLISGFSNLFLTIRSAASETFYAIMVPTLIFFGQYGVYSGQSALPEEVRKYISPYNDS